MLPRSYQHRFSHLEAENCLGTDGCAAVTGEKNGVLGLLRQENTQFMSFGVEHTSSN